LLPLVQHLGAKVEAARGSRGQPSGVELARSPSAHVAQMLVCRLVRLIGGVKFATSSDGGRTFNPGN